MKSKKTPRAKTSDDERRPESENVVDLMDALKKSLKQSKGGKSGGRRKRAS
jgi:DNA end-binding protein Ku